MATKKNEIQKTLEKLGTGVTAIAAGLKKRGIQGTPEEPQSCPLANYLSESLRADEVAVNETEVVVTFTVPLSSPFRKFVQKFDNGNYPDLVA